MVQCSGESGSGSDESGSWRDRTVLEAESILFRLMRAVCM